MPTGRIGNYAFYGTLRKGMENHEPFAGALSYLRTVVLSGYRMYALPEYPYVTYSGRDEDTIVAELFTISHSQTEQIIYEMEIEVGYILSTVEIEGDKFGLYIFPANDPSDERIPDGDWIAYAAGRSF